MKIALAPGRFWRYRHLIWQMTRREVVGRYQGSLLGLVWSFFHPVLLLAVYTFVFSVVFKARWGSAGEGKTEFALILFAGLIVFNLFAEVLNRSPGLVLSQANLVKKVVFPLEILPVVATGSALFHALVSVLVLLLALLLAPAGIPATAAFLPLVLAPLVLLTLGLSWLLASLGVYLRDISQAIGLLTTALLFLSPVFFPVSALPASVRPFLFLNPLTFVIEQVRLVMIWGEAPDWPGLLTYTLIGILTVLIGLGGFQKMRRGFADVL